MINHAHGQQVQVVGPRIIQPHEKDDKIGNECDRHQPERDRVAGNDQQGADNRKQSRKRKRLKQENAACLERGEDEYHERQHNGEKREQPVAIATQSVQFFHEVHGHRSSSSREVSTVPYRRFDFICAAPVAVDLLQRPRVTRGCLKSETKRRPSCSAGQPAAIGRLRSWPPRSRPACGFRRRASAGSRRHALSRSPPRRSARRRSAC